MQIEDTLRRLESMQIQPRVPQRLQELHENTLREHAPLDGAEKGADFGAMLRNGLQAVSDQGKDVENKMKGLITGETESVHEVLSAMGKSEVQFDLLLQVRNKLIEAWQKLSQIRV